MAQNNSQAAASTAAGAQGGAWQRNPPINVDFRIVWHIIEKGARVVPTYKITIETRQRVRISIESEEVEIGYDGVTLSDGVDELIIDHRYNTALLRRNGELVAVSDKVRYHGQVMSAADFVHQLKKSAKELIEGAVAEIASRA